MVLKFSLKNILVFIPKLERKWEKMGVEVDVLEAKLETNLQSAVALNVLTTKCKNLKTLKNSQNFKYRTKMVIWDILQLFTFFV